MEVIYAIQNGIKFKWNVLLIFDSTCFNLGVTGSQVVILEAKIQCIIENAKDKASNKYRHNDFSLSEASYHLHRTQMQKDEGFLSP